ncbi:substrate-binding domain-containing protein [Kitasatospora sp. NPDC094019]|uniref:substrate-binding domain-containing protein n=1 Tax=Kitasatospora sp. NPDC094019 TaxID=3364091 RepID=UPI0038106886
MTDREHTAEPGSRRRGPYRKSAERRREILDAALSAFAERGYHSSSVREIADRVGMTAPGLLHHFGSKEALLIEVLRHRDLSDLGIFSTEDPPGIDVLRWLAATAERNSLSPGLVKLHSVLSSEAADPAHPAHEYFAQRYEWLRGHLLHAFEQLAATGGLRPGVRPGTAARTSIAVMDGLQAQWLLNPAAVDLREDLSSYFQVLLTPDAWARPSGGPAPQAPDGTGTATAPAPAARSLGALRDSRGPEPTGTPGTAGQPQASIQDVARLAGVSVASVSRALNDRPGVSAVTRANVVRAAGELGYTLSMAARALKTGLTGRVAINVPWLGSAYAAQIVEAAAERLQSAELSLALTTTSLDPARLASVVAQLDRRRCDGVIHLVPFGAQGEFRELAASGLPVVLVDPAFELDLPFPVVTCDNISGGRQAVQHLVRLGHTGIGLITGPPDLLSTRERLTGARQAMAEAGLDLDETLVRHGRLRPEDGFTATMSLLGAPRRPTALFVFNDRMAAGALRAARSLGLDLPGDLSVVGFDDDPSAALVSPSLTTVRQPLAQLGTTAAQLLLDRIGGQEPRTARTTLPVELVIRASTAPAR